MSQSPKKFADIDNQGQTTADNDITLNLDITGIQVNGGGQNFEIE